MRILLICVFLLIIEKSKAEFLIVQFYDQSLTIDRGGTPDFKRKFSPNNNGLDKFQKVMKKNDPSVLLQSLLYYKEKMSLNDWLYYELIQKVSLEFTREKTTSVYITWYLLGKSGFKTSLAFNKSNVYIFVTSEESIYYLQKAGPARYCINCPNNELEFLFGKPTPFNRGKEFQFQFDPLPKWNSNYFEKSLTLKPFNDIPENKITLSISNSLIKAYRNLPNSSYVNIFSAELSSRAANLLETLEVQLQGADDSTKVSYLMDFTTSITSYSDDFQLYGKNDKWMTPEEFLFYGSGDCEDRSSFLFFLLKKIVKKPLVIVYYPKEQHLNIAVSLDLSSEASLVYNEKKFYTCEVTVENGFIPLGMDNLAKVTRYEIVGEYKPKEIK